MKPEMAMGSSISDMSAIQLCHPTPLTGGSSKVSVAVWGERRGGRGPPEPEVCRGKIIEIMSQLLSGSQSGET